ncbi:MAG: biotin--[acetyl-CoA-carboxylase] ligase [Desulfonatronovibrionaceae bacterium]
MHTVYVKDVLPQGCFGLGSGQDGRERIFSFGRAGSCLDLAWDLLDQGGLQTWDSVLCESQSGGRGRMRRVWHSPPGNIYAAWLWPDPKPGWENLISLAAGYALCRGLFRLGAGVRIKWPNDLWGRGGKAGGISVEQRRGRCMVGAGINLHSPPDETGLRANALGKAFCLGPELPKWSISGLWACLVYQGRNWYEQKIAASDPVDVVPEFEEVMAFKGEYVCLQTDTQKICGRLMGLTDKGEICIYTSKGMRSLASGTLVEVRSVSPDPAD